MRYLLLLLLIGCASPAEPAPAPESEFALSSAGAMIFDGAVGKEILLNAWVIRIGYGENDAEVAFYIRIDGDMIETVLAYPEIAHKDSSVGFTAKSTTRPYTIEELQLITIDATVSSMEE